MICLPPIDPMMHYGDRAKTQGPGDRQLIHYRLISIMSAISKELERVVHYQLLTYLQSHEILSPY